MINPAHVLFIKFHNSRASHHEGATVFLLPLHLGGFDSRIWSGEEGHGLLVLPPCGFLCSIDASNTTERMGHLVNDAPASEANCYMKLIYVKGSSQLFLFATQTIKPGDELSYDYGDKVANLWWRAKVQ